MAPVHPSRGVKWPQVGVLAMSLAVLAVAQPVLAQAPYKAPRNAFGQPDLSGTWTNASLTQLERPPYLKELVITEAQAAQMERGIAAMREADAKPLDPNAPPPAAANDPGGYNAFWLDPGSKVGMVRGERRSSWITEPANGRLPYSAEGRRQFMSWVTRITTNYDDPEARQLAERCLLGFGSTAGPPMMNVLYNNHYQIQQNADHLVILVEMNNDARVIRLDDARRLPAHIRPWMGSSVGRWEGETLVVETTNFNPGEALRPGIPTTFFVSKDAKVTERFTRISQAQILYQFQVDDPATYTQPWRGEMPFNVSKGPVYEYACHEGNYALPGILAGARQTEAAGGKVEAAAIGE